ncbi:uncharacterized protein GIQ15_01163 [Arthroderma uncinatum]|uniref:uncharacterized protein n=1 Tax=Arthroderma uncinatum TaxID=74035 RepID=UPI00144A4D2A|nr:uncharacterized protein GIQ15_01163 [Arthroderma uncinatum]KAF3491646.1 hypothetical protein GIQ15_01163 [Arthroderma uncinatum]
MSATGEFDGDIAESARIHRLDEQRETSLTSATPPPLSYYLQQLESFASPVPDLAATLMSNPEDEIHTENVSFLRSRRRTSTELSPSRARTRRRQLGGGGAGAAGGGGGSGGGGGGAGLGDSSHDSFDFGVDQHLPRSHQQYSSGHSQRIPIVRRRGAMNMNHGPAYEGPPQQSNRIYSWAPSPDEEGLFTRNDPLHPRDEMWFGRSAPRDEDDSFWSHLPRELRATVPPASESSPEEQDAGRAVGVPTLPLGRDNPALVTAALLQSVRRHHRYSPRARAMQNHTQQDGERTRPDGTRDRTSNPVSNNDDYASASASASASTSFSNHTRRLSPRLPPPARVDTSRNSDIRRMYLKDPSVDRLKETIQYLDRVRFSSSYEESLSTAAAGGFVQFEYFLRNEDDFILNTGSIAGPGHCSWLSPGTVFSGQQQASASTAMLPHRLLGTSRPTEPVAVPGIENRISVYTSSGRSYWATNVMGNNNGNPDPTEPTKTESWPVKVTIHHVDYNTMTLSGTMEAYNIPDKSANNQGAHIITFLEGEIIDFNTHTLETKNFNAGPEVDSCYWRELEPFKNLTYDEIVKNLVSKKWVTEKLSKGWILMRWKERCFVSPSHSRQGLTISGFYYISVHRETGHIEGMYYDPGSSPYQQLSLDPILKDKMSHLLFNLD